MKYFMALLASYSFIFAALEPKEFSSRCLVYLVNENKFEAMAKQSDNKMKMKKKMGFLWSKYKTTCSVHILVVFPLILCFFFSSFFLFLFFFFARCRCHLESFVFLVILAGLLFYWNACPPPHLASIISGKWECLSDMFS